jgi:hypothetical protein
MHAFTQIPTVLKYAGKYAALSLRLFYDAKKLDSFLIFDVSASGDMINYQYVSQDCTCWIVVSNFSPFDYTIDRIKIEVAVEGGSFSCTNTTPYLVEGNSRKQIYVKGSSPMTKEVWEMAKNSKRGWVNIEARINTSIHSFNLTRQITDVKNIRVL